MRLCVIPARGGSKRIPRKNIRNFLDKPIIGYSIEAAIKSKLFDRVIVSTDDEDIAKVSESFGAEIPFVRPKDLSDDFTPTIDVVNHAVNWFESRNETYDFICCLYATAPFIQKEFLIDGLKRLSASDKLYAFSVTSFPFPIQRALRIINDGVEAIWPENIEKRSQDLEESFHDAGQFYWGKKEAFVNNEAIFSPHSIPIILPRHFVQDIDTEEDWERAEMMLKVIQLSESK